MNENIELKLVEKYPKILKDYRGDMMQTCMAFCIETGDGWYDLLDKCMEKIQYFCDLCSKDGREVQVVAAQIKSKFGSLRFYTDIYGATELETKIIYDFVNIAESRSNTSCEVCGDLATRKRANGWFSCLCEEHSKENNL